MGFTRMIKSSIGAVFALSWCVVIFIAWWVGTSGNGWLGLGIMFTVLVVEGIIYGQMTKVRKPKPESEKKKKRRRR